MKGYFSGMGLNYLTTKEAAARFSLSDARIRQMVMAGVIRRYEQPGGPKGLILIPEAEIKRLENTERKGGRPRKSE